MKSIQSTAEQSPSFQSLSQINNVTLEKLLIITDFVKELDLALHQLRNSQDGSILDGFKLKELMLKLKQFSCE